MAKRLQNPRSAQINRSYKVDEIADLYGTHKNTVLNWIKQGLQTCDTKRPILIKGSALNEFHAKRRIRNKRPCKEHEIYCMRCKKPQIPVSGLVEFKPINDKTGNLTAICSHCETIMHRRVSLTKIQLFSAQMGFTLPLEHLRIIESPLPSLDCDFKKGKNHEKT